MSDYIKTFQETIYQGAVTFLINELNNWLKSIMFFLSNCAKFVKPNIDSKTLHCKF